MSLRFQRASTNSGEAPCLQHCCLVIDDNTVPQIPTRTPLHKQTIDRGSEVPPAFYHFTINHKISIYEDKKNIDTVFYMGL